MNCSIKQPWNGSFHCLENDDTTFKTFCLQGNTEHCLKVTFRRSFSNNVLGVRNIAWLLNRRGAVIT